MRAPDTFQPFGSWGGEKKLSGSWGGKKKLSGSWGGEKKLSDSWGDASNINRGSADDHEELLMNEHHHGNRGDRKG